MPFVSCPVLSQNPRNPENPKIGSTISAFLGSTSPVSGTTQAWTHRGDPGEWGLKSAGVSNYSKIGERPGIGLPVDIKKFHRGGTRNFDFEKYFGSIFDNSPSNNSPLKSNLRKFMHGFGSISVPNIKKTLFF